MIATFLRKMTGARSLLMLVVSALVLFFMTPASAFASPQAAPPGPDAPLPPRQLSPGNYSYVTPPFVTFEWTPTESASYYDIVLFREDRQEDAIRLRVPSTITSYTYNGLDAGYSYFWTVETDVPTDGSNIDFWVFTLSAQPIAPMTPQGVRASDGTIKDEVEILWYRSLRAAYYLVQRRAPGAANFEDIARIGSEMRFVDTHAAITVHYEYRVLACNSAGCSAPSPVDEGWAGVCAPVAPPVLKSPANGATIRFTAQDPYYYLSWTPNPTSPGHWLHVWDVATGHTVLREHLDWPGADSWDVAGQAGHLAWNVEATNPVAGCPNSPPSETWTYTAIQNPPPPVPINVQASDGAYPDRVVISWVDPPSNYDVESHEIYRSTQPDPQTAVSIESPFAPSPFEDTTVTPGVRYYYWVAACSHADGCSAKSAASDSGYAGTLPPLVLDHALFMPVIGR